MIQNQPNSENGRLRRDGNTVPNQTQNSSKQQVSDSSYRRRGFQLKKHEDESCAWQQRVKLPITIATRAKLPRLQSSAYEIEHLSKVCQIFRLLEQKVQHACQTCRFQNWGANQTQISNLPSLPFSELVPIKHTLTLNKIASKAGLKSSDFEKLTFNTKNAVALTYKSYNEYLSGNNLPLAKQNRSIEAARAPSFIDHSLNATTTTF